MDGAGSSPGFGFFTSAPTEGTSAALHGFDGDGPGTIEIYQDLTLGGETALRFDYRAAWDLLNFGAILDRSFEVVVEPAGGGVPLQTDLILTASAGTVTRKANSVSSARFRKLLLFFIFMFLPRD